MGITIDKRCQVRFAIPLDLPGGLESPIADRRSQDPLWADSVNKKSVDANV